MVDFTSCNFFKLVDIGERVPKEMKSTRTAVGWRGPLRQCSPTVIPWGKAQNNFAYAEEPPHMKTFTEKKKFDRWRLNLITAILLSRKMYL